MMKIRITPVLSGLVDGKPFQVRYTQVATEVSARDGQPVRLGGMDRHNEFYNRFLIGIEKTSKTSTLNITMTPRIMRPGQAPVVKPSVKGF